MFMPIDVLNVLCAQLTRDLFAIAQFLLIKALAEGCWTRKLFAEFLLKQNLTLPSLELHIRMPQAQWRGARDKAYDEHKRRY